MDAPVRARTPTRQRWLVIAGVVVLALACVGPAVAAWVVVLRSDGCDAPGAGDALLALSLTSVAGLVVAFALLGLGSFSDPHERPSVTLFVVTAVLVAGLLGIDLLLTVGGFVLQDLACRLH